MIIGNLLTRYMRRTSRRHFDLQMTSRPLAFRPSNEKSYLLYVHIPFCESLCSYCSFYRVPFEETLANRYFDCLEMEIELLAGEGFQVSSVYIGGGTPTVLPSKLLNLLRKIQSIWPLKEVSVETYAQHLTPDILQLLKEGGVNRLSVGVQSFDRALLRSMNRHRALLSLSETKRRILLAHEFFSTVNIDMIYNFPSQTRLSILEDIRILRELEVDQVTFYPLMSSAQPTHGFPTKGERVSFPKEKRFCRLIVRELKDSYSMSSAWCFSRKRRDISDAHSMIDEYIVDYDEYLAAGAGAFGFLSGTFYANIFSVERYIHRLKSGHLPIMASRQIPLSARARYDFLMKLFGTSVKLEFLRKKYGPFFLLRVWRELFLSLTLGAVKYRNGNLFLRPEKAYYLVTLMREFFSGVNRFRAICTEENR